MVILENALDVCEYTDVVDVTFSHLRTSKSSRMLSSLVDLLAIQCGLIMSNDLSKGEALLTDKSLDQNVPLFSKIFEIGRRYKIMNPSKMRDTYGKLMYVCMDTRQHLDLGKTGAKLEFVEEIKTVARFLQGTGCEDLMNDPLLKFATEVLDEQYPEDDISFGTATAAEEGKSSSTDTDADELDISNHGDDDAAQSMDVAGRSRSGSSSSSGAKHASHSLTAVERRSQKHKAHEELVEKYSQRALKFADDGTGKIKAITKDEIELVIASIADNNAFLNYNAGCVDRMLKLLDESFDPNKIQENFSLELRGTPRKAAYSYMSSFSYGFSSSYKGKGACLSHDHKTQYAFVMQSLTLWKEIMTQMSRLWLAADHDLLNEYYRLADTGQGYQRLQSCPKVGNLMQRILRNVQTRVGSPWVGLSVIHLGDRDVPNALVFIDKYTQVPRILTPIAQCIQRLPAVLYQDKAMHHYVKEEWGSIDGLRLQILCDFFKHGFDGSGDDGGSCIDGRLTSSWNWCSKLHKKPYYHVFMFTGFQGFDGDWKQD